MQWADRKLGFNELSHLVDMTPFYRFGYMAANGAILDAIDNATHVHIVDFSTSHCMQWPTLIDSLADRMDAASPTSVRLTVSTPTLLTPPQLHPTYAEVGHRLAWWASKKGVPFEFQILHKPLESLLISDIDLRDGEALAVNCSLRLHYLPDEGATSLRENFLHLVRYLNPTVVTVFEEDCDVMGSDLVSRVQNFYDHEWMKFDYLATYSSHGRVSFEREVGQRIENVVACEGGERIERLEAKAHWGARLQRVGFRALPIGEDVVAAVREMVRDYAVGWGMKVDDDHALTLSWKGHSLAFASAWAPAPWF